jgi:translin
MTKRGFSNLDEVVDALEADLDAKHEAREAAKAAVRDLTRRSREAIQALHRGEDAGSEIEEAIRVGRRLAADLEDHPDLLESGLVRNAHQELAEAVCLERVLRGAPLPDPDEVPVTARGYLLGLGDLAGELRRLALDALGEGDVDAARNHLAGMEDIKDALMRFDYPSGLVNVRGKQDTARNLLDRTRGEVATTLEQRRLADRLEALDARLDGEAEPGTDVEGGDEDEPDLDIDSVW